ncbi:MAG: osmY [candidate division NC10 bacterium]|nr:osmY [candidate division NC10 bacterium]
MPKRIMLSACMLAALAIVTTPSYGGEKKAKSTTQKAATGMSDSWVTAKTKIALFADDRVKVTQVNVDTSNGVVTLRGKVDSEQAKSAAADVAKGIEGAKSVKNELQVVAPAERKAVDATDDQITNQVKDRLSKDPHLKNADIDVRTDAKVVTLTGKVPDIMLSASASEMARAVPGVRYVKNDLSVVSTKSKRYSESRGNGRSGAVSAGYRENVKAAQDAMKAKGFDPGPIDGIMGPKTTSALKDFQKREGLQVTGRLNAETQARLERRTGM